MLNKISKIFGFFLRFFFKDLRDIKKNRDEFIELKKKHANMLKSVFRKAEFEEKYFSTLRRIENEKLTDLEENILLKRAVFFRDVMRGKINLEDEATLKFLKEEERLQKYLEKERRGEEFEYEQLEN